MMAGPPTAGNSSRPGAHYNVTGPSGSSLPHFGGNAPLGGGAVGLMINENTSHGDEDDMSDDDNGTESQQSPG
jgi:hypothetical protein